MRIVQADGYKGYRRHNIDHIAALTEPQRSEGLRKLRGDVLHEFKSNLKRYREVVFYLNYYRKTGEHIEEQAFCNDVFMSVSLKYCHLLNDFAHFIEIDRHLAVQPDLFVAL